MVWFKKLKIIFLLLSIGLRNISRKLYQMHSIKSYLIKKY